MAKAPAVLAAVNAHIVPARTALANQKLTYSDNGKWLSVYARTSAQLMTGNFWLQATTPLASMDLFALNCHPWFEPDTPIASAVASVKAQFDSIAKVGTPAQAALSIVSESGCASRFADRNDLY